MYNLAKRQGLPKVGETPDNVAANTYIFDDYKTFQRNKRRVRNLVQSLN